MGKRKILEKIMSGKPGFKSLPGKFEAKESFRLEQLAEVFGQQALQVGSEIKVLQDVKEIAPFLSEQFPGGNDFRIKENWEKYSGGCPKEELKKLNTVILEGRIGVVENGAIWLDNFCFPNRLIPFITEQLVIIVPKKNLVATMNEAYEIISKIDYAFGVFVSGPSKTADIEQSLVYGAHGAKNQLVLLLN